MLFTLDIYSFCINKYASKQKKNTKKIYSWYNTYTLLYTILYLFLYTTFALSSRKEIRYNCIKVYHRFLRPANLPGALSESILFRYFFPLVEPRFARNCSALNRSIKNVSVILHRKRPKYLSLDAVVIGGGFVKRNNVQRVLKCNRKMSFVEGKIRVL